MKFREYLLNEAVKVNDPPLVKQIKKICQTKGLKEIASLLKKHTYRDLLPL